MSTGAKFYKKILLNRLRPYVEPKLRVNQASFISGRGTVELINALRWITEGAIVMQLPLIVTYVDFCKAFDFCKQAIALCDSKTLRRAIKNRCCLLTLLFTPTRKVQCSSK